MAGWRQPVLITATALLLWTALIHMIFWTNVGEAGLFHLRALIAYILLIVAPAVTFVPLARWMQAPLYEIEGIVSWGLLGFLLTFVTPGSPPAFGQFLVFLVVLTVALATVGTLLAYLAALRILLGRPYRHDVVRARRQGYLASFYFVSIVVLHSVGTLSATSAAMLFVIVVLMEMLVLAHGGRGRSIVRAGLGPRASSRRAS